MEILIMQTRIFVLDYGQIDGGGVASGAVKPNYQLRLLDQAKQLYISLTAFPNNPFNYPFDR
jgi:hypothetical protein